MRAFLCPEEASLVKVQVFWNELIHVSDFEVRAGITLLSVRF